MYEKYFYLKENPFHITPDTRFLYMSRTHAEAIELMGYGVKEKKGFVMLTGEVGTGKTTLCRALIERLPKKIETAMILNPVLSGRELLKTVTADFGLNPRSDTVKGHLDSLNGFLLKTAEKGGGALIIIDEAQNLNPQALEMLRLLSNLETEREKLLQIIMVGQPELIEKLGLPELRQLNQRVIVRYSLGALNIEETREYIKNRLKVAGGGTTVEFSEDAVAQVHSSSKGIPRLINIICDRSLTAAFVHEKKAVDGETVHKAVEELKDEGLIRLNTASKDAPYLRYTPHIAFSAFALSFAAGFIWGPVIIRMTSLLALFP